MGGWVDEWREGLVGGWRGGGGGAGGMSGWLDLERSMRFSTYRVKPGHEEAGGEGDADHVVEQGPD